MFRSVGRGQPDDRWRDVEEWRAAGATHLRVNAMGGGLAGPDAHIECLRRAPRRRASGTARAAALAAAQGDDVATVHGRAER